MEFDHRRRPYVPLDVMVAFEDFGTALAEKWGMEGLCAWMLFLAACKREAIQGTFTYTTEAEGWGKLGAQASLFTLADFFRFTGRWKKTSKRRSGRINYVTVVPKLWNKWNTTNPQNPRKRPSNTRILQKDSGKLHALKAEAEEEVEKQAEELPFKMPADLTARGDLLAAIRNRDGGTDDMLREYEAVLPPAALITAREDLTEHYAIVKNDAAYVRTILSRMVSEGQYAA